MRSSVIMEDGDPCALVVCWEVFRGVVIRATALAVAAAPVSGAARAFLVVPVTCVSPSLFLFEDRIPDIIDSSTATFMLHQRRDVDVHRTSNRLSVGADKGLLDDVEQIIKGGAAD
jgi:hypothetical protein